MDAFAVKPPDLETPTKNLSGGNIQKLILALSDRIAVMFEGRIMGILSREAASRKKIGLMMAGVDPDSEPLDYCPAP